jgi:hypothetical protein
MSSKVSLRLARRELDLSDHDRHRERGGNGKVAAAE